MTNREVEFILSMQQRLSEDFKRVRPLVQELSQIEKFVNTRALEFALSANRVFAKLAFPPDLMQLEHPKDANEFRKKMQSGMPAKMAFDAKLLSLQSQLSRLYEISLCAERALALVDFDKIGCLVNTSEELTRRLNDVHSDFAEAYSNLFSSFVDSPHEFPFVASTVRVLPPIEFYLNNRFIQSISTTTHESDEDRELRKDLDLELSDEVESELSKFDQGWLKMWRGARAAQLSTNHDSIRHFCISLRELLTNVIHQFAPDDAIAEWSTQPDMYHEGKPTRRARLRYICRSVDQEPFDKLVDRDIDATISCIQVLQEGTHGDPSLTPIHLDLLRMRVGSSLRFILKIVNDASPQ